VAYSAATGRRLWVSHYHGPGIGPGNDYDGASAVAVSPAGSTVFVTGTSTGRRTGQSDCATVTYSAATGRQLWARRYNGPANGFDGASAVAVSPGGATVFVTGYSGRRPTANDYATVAYSAATGRQLWVSRYHGYEAISVAVSPAGTTVYVTGYSGGHADYATVAYGAATGRQLWASRYHGPANNGGACCVAVSPAGTTVFVTGWSEGRTSYGYATVAYRG